MDHTHHQRIGVAFDYPVVFTRDLFDPANAALAGAMDRLGEGRRHRAMVFLDAGAAAAHPGLADRAAGYFAAHAGRIELAAAPCLVSGGEAIKNDYRLLMQVVDAILEHRLCRHSFVVAAGGGAVLDAVGFAAAIVHRGLRLVRAPTTVLAQNDAGVGVKNGMNLHGGKNTVGVFHPPFAVLNDALFLRTLPWRDWIAGHAEAFKVALIKDADFFRFLCARAPAIGRRDEDTMAEAVRRCALLHLDHIAGGGDPFEVGAARPLDFGHWAAHKLESLSGYRIRHGEAVAAGVALDSLYAAERGWLSAADAEAALSAMETSGLPLWQPELERRHGDGRLAVLDGLEEFREHLGGALCVTYPRGLGRRREVDAVDPAGVERAVAALQRRAATARNTR